MHVLISVKSFGTGKLGIHVIPSGKWDWVRRKDKHSYTAACVIKNAESQEHETMERQNMKLATKDCFNSNAILCVILSVFILFKMLRACGISNLSCIFQQCIKTKLLSRRLHNNHMLARLTSFLSYKYLWTRLCIYNSVTFQNREICIFCFKWYHSIGLCNHHGRMFSVNAWS